MPNLGDPPPIVWKSLGDYLGDYFGDSFNLFSLVTFITLLGAMVLFFMLLILGLARVFLLSLIGLSLLGDHFSLLLFLPGDYFLPGEAA